MNITENAVRVGIADLNVVRGPQKIRTLGLGSCVGVVLYDSNKQIAGLAHILLPDSKLTKQKTTNEYKYADTAIPVLLTKLLELGADKYALKAKIAGGAEMFKFSSTSEMLKIGPRNIAAVIEQLNHLRIPIISKDVGGNVGRTIEFNPVTDKLMVRKINQEIDYI